MTIFFLPITIANKKDQRCRQSRAVNKNVSERIISLFFYGRCQVNIIRPHRKCLFESE